MELGDIFVKIPILLGLLKKNRPQGPTFWCYNKKKNYIHTNYFQLISIETCQDNIHMNHWCEELFFPNSIKYIILILDYEVFFKTMHNVLKSKKYS